MRMLVLGGTRFVGRAIVEAALDRNHEVALFNRVSHREVLPEARRIVGDRDTDDVHQLAGGAWDAVVDVSAYKPAQVRRVLEVLGGEVGHWLYISTVSVYDNPPPESDESAAVLHVDESIPDGSPDAYGGL